jgi:hypothetical protein
VTAPIGAPAGAAAIATAPAAAAPAPAPTPATGADASGGRGDAMASDVRADAAKVAAAFSDDEEAFFSKGSQPIPVVPVVATESFGDLDADYQPVGFWDRLRGAKPSKASNPTKPTKPTKK